MDEAQTDYVRWIRRRVGHRKIFLVFASVVLRDERGRVLLQRRTDFDFWGLPGGALEVREDILTCARRELREETGLEAGGLRLVGVYSDPGYDVVYGNGDEVQQFTVCFAGRRAGGPMQPDGVETRAQRFFAAHALPWGQLPPWYATMMHDALAGGPPAFRAPHARAQRIDQITLVRAYLGHARYIGPGAKAIVVRADGRLLLVRRAASGAWVFPGGFMDVGENVAHTVVREVREETGYEIWPERIVAVYSSPSLHHAYANGDLIKPVGVIFRARLQGGHGTRAREEVSELAWVTPREALRYPRLAGFQAVYERALHHLDEGYFVC